MKASFWPLPRASVHIGCIGFEDLRQGVANGSRTGAKGLGLGLRAHQHQRALRRARLAAMARRSARKRVLSA